MDLKPKSPTRESALGVGVGNTLPMSTLLEDENNEINVFCDWLSFTISYENTRYFDENGEEKYYQKSVDDNYSAIIDKLKSIFNIPDDDVYNEEFGRYGYKGRLSLGEFITVNFGGGPLDKYGNRTISVEISGSGIRYLERNIENFDLRELLITLKSNFLINVTRFDFSLDLFTKRYFTLNYFYESILQGKYVCLAKKKKFIYEPLDKKGEIMGLTIYLGSQVGSNRYLCIYDKLREQQVKNGLDFFDKECWYRFEFRFFRENAKNLVDEIIRSNNLINLYKGILFDYLELKTRSRNEIANASKLLIDPQWEKFMNGISKYKVSNHYDNIKTFAKKRKWHKDYASRYLAEFLIYDSENFADELLINVAEFSKDFSKKDLFLVNEQRRLEGLAPVSWEHAKDFFTRLQNKYLKKEGLENE